LAYEFNPSLANLDTPAGFSVDVSSLKYIWLCLLKCVATLHQHKIIHRDLKPDNFVVCNGVITLIDLGLAGKLQQTLGTKEDAILSRHLMGTLDYLAPEIYDGRVGGDPQNVIRYTRAVDVWALGVTLYHIVTGAFPVKVDRKTKLPFAGWWINFDANNLFAKYNWSVSSLQSCIVECLQVDPRKRPTVEQLLAHPFLSNDDAPDNVILRLPKP